MMPRYRKEGFFLNFVEFIVYIKNTGRKVLAFFPSKTDLISCVDRNGNVTDELLSERLGYIKENMDTFQKKGIIDVELKDASDEIKSEYQYVGEETSITGASCYAVASKAYAKNDIFYLSSTKTVTGGPTWNRTFLPGYYKYTGDTDSSTLYDFYVSKAYYAYLGTTCTVSDTHTYACNLNEKISILDNDVGQLQEDSIELQNNISELTSTAGEIEKKNEALDVSVCSLKEQADLTEEKEALYDKIVTDLLLKDAYREKDIKIITVEVNNGSDGLYTTTELEIGSYFYMQSYTLSYAGIKCGTDAGYYVITGSASIVEDIGYVLFPHPAIAANYNTCISYVASTLEELKEATKEPVPVYCSAFYELKDAPENVKISSGYCGESNYWYPGYENSETFPEGKIYYVTDGTDTSIGYYRSVVDISAGCSPLPDPYDTQYFEYLGESYMIRIGENSLEARLEKIEKALKTAGMLS